MSNRCLGNHIKIERQHWNFRFLNSGQLNQLVKISEFLRTAMGQDIRILQHLCARVTGAKGKTYFVDEKEVIEKILRDALVN